MLSVCEGHVGTLKLRYQCMHVDEQLWWSANKGIPIQEDKHDKPVTQRVFFSWTQNSIVSSSFCAVGWITNRDTSKETRQQNILQISIIYFLSICIVYKKLRANFDKITNIHLWGSLQQTPNSTHTLNKINETDNYYYSMISYLELSLISRRKQLLKHLPVQL